MKKKASRKAIPSSKLSLVPTWQRRYAQTAPHSSALFSRSSGGVRCIEDADPYDCVLRTNADRLAHYAGTEMSTEESPFVARKLLREAALLLDLLAERQRAKRDAAE